MKEKHRIVVDTNVVVAALRSRNGTSNKLLQLVGGSRFATCISVGLVLEYEAVLTRHIRHLTKKNINQFLDYICAVSEHIKIHFLWRPILKDPNDDMLLELAVAANAKYIITYNIADFKYADKFNVKIINPKQFLQLIGELS